MHHDAHHFGDTETVGTSLSPTSPPPKPIVLCVTVVHWISWAAFLDSISEEGAKTFFSTLSVQESLTEEFNRPADSCFLDGTKVSREQWKDHIVAKFDSAYVNKIPGGKEWLARKRNGGAEVDEAGDGEEPE